MANYEPEDGIEISYYQRNGDKSLRTLYVGDLAPKVTEEIMKKTFGDNVESVRLPKSSQLGKKGRQMHKGSVLVLVMKMIFNCLMVNLV